MQCDMNCALTCDGGGDGVGMKWRHKECDGFIFFS